MCFLKFTKEMNSDTWPIWTSFKILGPLLVYLHERFKALDANFNSIIPCFSLWIIDFIWKIQQFSL